MEKLEAFPADDGHIESLVIGVDQVKVSLHTWNDRALVLIYGDVREVRQRRCVGPDLGGYTETPLPDGLCRYRFSGAWDRESYLEILAGTCTVYETGPAGDINDALYDVGLDYLGGQAHPFDSDNF